MMLIPLIPRLFLLLLSFSCLDGKFEKRPMSCNCTMDQWCDRKIGICKDMWPERCLQANCSVIFQPNCPSDSKLVIEELEPGQCCRKAGKCQCKFTKCIPPYCSSEFERIRITSSTRKPGNCCNTYQCRPKKLDCDNFICPPEIQAEWACPKDSIRPVNYVPQGSCCPITQRQHSCRCKPGICLPLQCEHSETVQITSKGNGTPGNCCDKFECAPTSALLVTNTNVDTPSQKYCPFKRELYPEGAIWYGKSTCEQCECKMGVAFCRKMMCDPPSALCSWVGVHPSECCPVCLGCTTESGEQLSLNSTWSKDDCTHCVCDQGGQFRCQQLMCTVHCDFPVKIPGQCCPVCHEPTVLTIPSICPSLEHCPLRCEYGLQKMDTGCFQCQCAPGTPIVHDLREYCPPLNDTNCHKQCAHGYLHTIEGCPVCKCAKCPPLHQCYKHCLYGFQANVYGCPLCICKESSSIFVDHVSSPSVISPDHHCVRVAGYHTRRDSGEWWHDGCRHCFCENNRRFCSLLSCPQRPVDCPEERWIRGEACCPHCSLDLPSDPPHTPHSASVCMSLESGRAFVDGEIWSLSPCIQCTCRVGHVLCTVDQCPPVVCESLNTVVDYRHGCCRSCVNRTSKSHGNSSFCTDDSGGRHSENADWKTNECKSCICTRKSRTAPATIACFEEQCPETNGCRQPLLSIKGKCCPLCAESLNNRGICKYKNEVYQSGEHWKDGHCRNCTCIDDGQTVCTQLQCPPCSLADDCCPPCDDNAWLSIGSNRGEKTANIDLQPQPVNLILLGTCVGVSILIVMAILLICWLIKRNQQSYTHCKMNNYRQTSQNANLLIKAKNAHSAPIVATKFDHQSLSFLSNSDLQNESLLSTVSNSNSQSEIKNQKHRWNSTMNNAKESRDRTLGAKLIRSLSSCRKKNKQQQQQQQQQKNMGAV